MQGDKPAEYASRSELLWAFVCAALRAGIDENDIIAACLDEAYAGNSVYEHVKENGGEGYIKKQIERAINDDGVGVGDKNKTLDPNDPMRTARALVAVAFTDANGLRTLQRHRGAFWSWTGSYYQLADDETIRASVWKFLDSSWRKEKTTIVPFKPNSARVSGALDALEAIVQLNKYIDPPAWLTRHDAPPAVELMACGNGLLHLPTGKIYPPTPDFFGISASEVIFDTAAPNPVLWLSFLKELFGGDTEAVETLQDWCGYVLAPNTSQQKMLLMVGPKRSGKGTIGRIMTKLLGRNSVAGPTMSSLGDAFGLEPLITKPLAIVSDARIGARTDKSTIVERLLSISGEDTMTVGRKFKDAWHGQLLTRFVVLTNELPSLTDGSGALAGRFIVLMLTKSFFGKEDPLLTDKLTAELPGILNWAIAGYRRLRARRYFVQPKSSQEAVDDIEMLAAPVKAFIRDYCDVSPGYEEPVDELWGWYADWCVQNRRKNPGTKQWFGRNLRSAEPGITTTRPGTGNDREPTYVGIRIKPEMKARRGGKLTGEVGHM